jgi:cold shock CspA family protein
MKTGKIIEWNVSLGYGWIQPDDSTEKVFIHYDQLITGEDYLLPDDPIRYTDCDSEKGLQATRCMTV